MIPISEVVARLKSDSAIAAIVGELVADYDPRRDKNPLYFDEDGDIRPCLAFADFGEAKIAGTHKAMSQDMFYVWAFAPSTPQGREYVRTLMPLVRTRLDDWKATTKQMMEYTNERLGASAASIVDSGLDRLTFRCVGVHAGTS